MLVLDDYLNVVEAAAILGVHWEMVKRLCRKGRIPAQKVHNTRYVLTTTSLAHRS